METLLPAPSRRTRAALALVLLIVAAPLRAGADGDAYKLHMENGVKLYTDRNFSAAVVEFQAAYEAKAGPNPLVNIALCDKEMFRYPQAIASLEKALAEHGAAMEAGDRKAAEDAIKEMRALIGIVTLALTPPGATVLVDGEEIPPGAAAKPIPLGPGTHKISASAPGFAPAEQTVTVRSKLDQTVTLALVAEKGLVTIWAPDPRMSIAVDDQAMGTGTWSGLLLPGKHVVRVSGGDGPPFAMEILVTAGVPLAVSKGVGGTLIVPPRKERFGPYVLGIGSILFPATHPHAFGPVARPDFGAGYGVRVGLQVNRVAGFEVTYEHSSISTYGTDPLNNYRMISDRVMIGMRLISNGRFVRFLGNFAGGFVNDQMYVNLAATCAMKTAVSPCFLLGNNVGIDALALGEAGLELDLDHMLIDLVAEGQIASTGNLSAANQNIYGALPLITGGPAVRFGYRFW